MTAPLKILIVDDDSDSADVLSLLLAIEGHETRVADGGREALSVFRAFKPDLVICDICMPSLNGLAFAEAVRTMNDRSQPVLVALSGFVGVGDKQAAADAGFDEFLAKPLDADRLREVVRARGRRVNAATVHQTNSFPS